MLRNEIEAFLAAQGWQRDRWGHYQGDRTVYGRAGGAHAGVGMTRRYRVKLQARTIRMELKSSLGWVRFTGAFYKDVRKLDDKTLLIGSYKAGPCDPA